MTEDIVLNITANIQPMANELNHLMSTMELVPNKEQLTEAIDSIHGAYQTIKTEIESDTGGIFADIPARMESALTRTITSIRSQITSLDGAFKKIGKNLDGDKSAAFTSKQASSWAMCKPCWMACKTCGALPKAQPRSK